MPVPRLIEYSDIQFQGYSGASHIIRPIYEPQMHASRVVLPDPRRPGLADRYEHRLAGARFDVKFGTEMRGRLAAAAIDTALYDGDLLHACGFDGFANTSTSYQYVLDNIHGDWTGGPPYGDLSHTDIAVYTDGLVSRGTDCVGNCAFHFPANDICTIDWDFSGKCSQGPVELPLPAVTESIGAIIVGNGATLSFTAGGAPITTICARDLTIDLKNTVTMRACIAEANGYTEPVLTDRDVTISGVIEAPTQALMDFNALVNNRTIITLALTVGATAKSIFTFAMKFTLNQYPELTNIDGILGYAFEGKMHPTGLLSIVVT
jgi:hypothetical protein